MNLEADRVEHQGGRRIMNRSHAFWSFGFFGAGLLGALAARVGISPQWHLASVVPLSALLILLLLGGFEAAPHRSGSNDEPAHHLARPTLAIVALVLFSLSGLVLEGAGIDWSAIYMRDVFAAVPFISGLAVAIGAFAQGAARYVADRFVERHSPLAIARTLLGVLGLGTLMVTFAPASPRGAARLCADRRGHQRDVSAGHVGGRPAHRSAGRHQRGGAGADLVRQLPARAAAAGLRRRTSGHPLDLRLGIAAGGAERRRCRRSCAKRSRKSPPRRLGEPRARSAIVLRDVSRVSASAVRDAHSRSAHDSMLAAHAPETVTSKKTLLARGAQRHPRCIVHPFLRCSGHPLQEN